MRLASLKQGRDGRLVLVSADRRRAVAAGDIAPTLQAALDDWSAAAPRLQELSDLLDAGRVEGMPFDECACTAPLPRAFQWADGSAYLNHVELVRRARGAEMPDALHHEPLLYQGGSDGFLGPRDPILLVDESWGLDFEAEIAIVTGHVPMGTPAQAAGAHIRLVMLANDISLRNLVPGEIAKGFGFFQSKPASAFSPLALTPDELGTAWDGAKLHLPLLSFVNDAPFGRPDAGRDMAFDFPRLIAHAARTRSLGAGTIIGSGTVSNRGQDGPGRPVAEGGAGYSCIAEQRMVETILTGAPRTRYLRPGDKVRIEMCDASGHSLFDAIEQVVVRQES